jgi:hypothetical protein
VPAQISLSVARNADIEQAKLVIASVRGVLRVRQVFPDQNDEELRRMFVVDLESEAKDAALATLRQSSLVEAADPVPRRGVSRPTA